MAMGIRKVRELGSAGMLRKHEYGAYEDVLIKLFRKKRKWMREKEIREYLGEEKPVYQVLDYYAGKNDSMITSIYINNKRFYGLEKWLIEKKKND